MSSIKGGKGCILRVCFVRRPVRKVDVIKETFWVLLKVTDEINTRLKFLFRDEKFSSISLRKLLSDALN